MFFSTLSVGKKFNRKERRTQRICKKNNQNLKKNLRTRRFFLLNLRVKKQTTKKEEHKGFAKKNNQNFKKKLRTQRFFLLNLRVKKQTAKYPPHELHPSIHQILFKILG